MDSGYVTCQCKNCRENIQFLQSDLTKENQVITCPHCKRETSLYIPHIKSFIWIVIGVLIVGISAIFFLLNGREYNSVKVERVTWDPDSIGGATMWIKISNELPRSIKDITIRITQIGQSGTELAQTTYTIYSIVPRHDEAGFIVHIDFADPQTASARCRVIDFSSL